MKNKNGFSLIELIVVITIIAVITVVGVVNFTEANKKARDSRRMSDLEKIRIALELIRQVGTTYPTTLNSLVPTYLQDIPDGPKKDFYDYTRVTNFSYTLDASLEGIGSTNGNYTTSTCGTGFVCNYRIKSP